MLFLSPLLVLYFFFLILGTFVAISASSWFMAWVGLELNLLSFLPVIFSESGTGSNESGVSYFFVQALASLLILVGSVFPFFMEMLGSLYLINFSLFVKLGASPFHFWFVSIMEGMGWGNCLLLMTWQSMAPLFLLLGFEVFSFICLCSALVGAFGGFNQVSLKRILAYSSVLHVGWMLAGMGISLKMGGFYFLVYFFMSVFIVVLLGSMKALKLNQLMVGEVKVKVGIFLLMLSLGGFPPLLGFFPSWGVILSLLSSDLFLMVFLLFSSLVNLYYYFRVMYGGIFLKGGFEKSLFWAGGESLMVVGVFFSTFGGVFYPILFL
uniref:NADH-ubiquinone oxidoreductase chain 2 n=1 Tax=Buthus occitanus TaxID=6868 RepID=B2CKV7_BUTOI|nr:NADH dehydrogenase subunit 2 [Buthus occitanus]ACA66065.1 NADH dehydrogenase subunit 2 [Buthus occitanus]